MRKFKMVYLIAIVFLLAVLNGCSGGGQERPEAKPNEDKEKIPSSLVSMDEAVHNLIEKIEGIDKVIEIQPKDIEPMEEEQQKEEKPASQSSTQQPTPQEKQEIIQQDKAAQILEKWKTAEEDLKSIHELWNEYESSAMKDGANPDKIQQMERALNNLTSYVDMQHQDGTLIEANNIILSVSNFIDFYQGNIDGLLGKIEYMARQSYMNAKEDDWLEAQEKVKQGDSLISSLRQRAKIKENQKPLIEKMALSIEDLEKAIQEENLKLLEIKRDIVIKNVETLKDELR